jgi:REP element-mobilizing transposase RayT
MDEPQSTRLPANVSGIAADLVMRRRDLPHWEMGGATYSLTFRLHGSPENLSPLTTDERQIVKKAILALHSQMWHVHLLTIMPNHLHIIATPMSASSGQWYALAAILQRVRGSTAFSINTLRHRKGPFWQKATFDRIVRDRSEFYEKATYILNNAVKAGIAEDGWHMTGFGAKAPMWQAKARHHR